MVKVVRGSRKRLTKRRKRKEDVRIGDWKDTHHESYSDDCLGDSELSDSDTEEERIDRMERDRREMRILLAKTRLSLAKNNLTVVIQMILFVCYAWKSFQTFKIYGGICAYTWPEIQTFRMQI